ncbi:hypothetical protein [Streptosporangium sp. NPDC020145]|uniref:hypothetical protein n=1 Tax=Streptosporangium sp. NPDC020145 TaxID=3154694 RepID=UPI00343E0F78
MSHVPRQGRGGERSRSDLAGDAPATRAGPRRSSEVSCATPYGREPGGGEAVRVVADMDERTAPRRAGAVPPKVRTRGW